MLLYRIFSYFLLVIGVFLGLSFLLGLLVATAYPNLLINLFILLTVVLYTFSSFLFLTRGIQGNQKFKQGFRDFIQVNALGSLVYVGRSGWDLVSFYQDKSRLKDFINQSLSVQKNTSIVSEAEILSLTKVMLIFLILYLWILVVHIAITFFNLRKYSALFQASQKQ